MMEKLSPSAAMLYGLAFVSTGRRLSGSTYYENRSQRHRPVESRKHGLQTVWIEEAVTERIREQIARSPFCGEGGRKVWALLWLTGRRTSKAQVLRLMRQARLLAPQRQAVPAVEKTHSGTITTDRPNRMWGIDATATVTLEEGQVTVFAAVDHCTAECVGIHAVKRARASRPWNPSARGSINTSEGFRPAPPRGSNCGTIMPRSSWATTSRTNSPSWESSLRRHSFASRKATAVSNASSGPSRSNCCGFGTSSPFRNWFGLWKTFALLRSLQPALVD